MKPRLIEREGFPMNVRTWIRKLDLMTLRLFASITEERNIGRAAVRESIASSAVTKRIQQLEDTLGFRLMYRDPRKGNPPDSRRAR